MGDTPTPTGCSALGTTLWKLRGRKSSPKDHMTGEKTDGDESQRPENPQKPQNHCHSDETSASTWPECSPETQAGRHPRRAKKQILSILSTKPSHLISSFSLRSWSPGPKPTSPSPHCAHGSLPSSWDTHRKFKPSQMGLFQAHFPRPPPRPHPVAVYSGNANPK